MYPIILILYNHGCTITRKQLIDQLKGIGIRQSLIRSILYVLRRHKLIDQDRSEIRCTPKLVDIVNKIISYTKTNDMRDWLIITKDRVLYIHIKRTRIRAYSIPRDKLCLVALYIRDRGEATWDEVRNLLQSQGKLASIILRALRVSSYILSRRTKPKFTYYYKGSPMIEQICHGT